MFTTLYGVYLHHPCYHHVQYTAWCVPSPSLLPSCLIYCVVCTFTILAAIMFYILHGVHLYHPCYHHVLYTAWCVPLPSLLPSCSLYCVVCTFTMAILTSILVNATFLFHHEKMSVNKNVAPLRHDNCVSINKLSSIIICVGFLLLTGWW